MAHKPWQSYFANLEAVSFPALPIANYQPECDKTLRHHVEDIHWPLAPVTPSTLIRTAWSLLIMGYTDTDDVVFGSIVVDHTSQLFTEEWAMGSMSHTVPMRVTRKKAESVMSMLSRIQQEAAEMVHFGHLELDEIRQLNDDTSRACQFQNALLVHKDPESFFNDEDLDTWSNVDSALSSPLSPLSPLTPLSSAPSPSSSPPSSASYFPSVHSSTEASNADIVVAQLDETKRHGTYALVLECQFKQSELQLKLDYDSKVLPVSKVERLFHQFEHILRQLFEASQRQGPNKDSLHRDAELKVEQLDLVSGRDVDQLRAWNREIPETTTACVHDIITGSVRRSPMSPAICAWDGNMTYEELDRASTALACELVTHGLQRGSIVPLCFEKSLWTSVAMLAVMKAGAASVLMDCSVPEERLYSIVAQLDTDIILASSSNFHLAEKLVPQGLTCIVGQAYISQLISKSYENIMLPKVEPTDLLYVVFTSGSTGTPKGARITHQNFCSGIRHQAEALRYSSQSRLYDFVSYSFDVIWPNLLQTLAAGGCLCVPSESDRKNDLEGSIRRLGANALHVTPSVARLISPGTVPMLKTVVLGGEAVLSSDVAQWKDVAEVFQVYGPAECVPPVMVAGCNEMNSSQQPNVGYGKGVHIWIANPSNHDQLVPIGAIGEILIEGPLVGEGYLNDPDRTEASFIRDPIWARPGGRLFPHAHSSRTTRLYKTGDLGRLDEDGSLFFLGRKDAQVKLNGQRIELGDIEEHVREALRATSTSSRLPYVDTQLAVEVAKVGENAKSTLILFLAQCAASSVTTHSGDEQDNQESESLWRVTISDIYQQLTKTLPAYMIPTAYKLISDMPMTATGKVDRRRLRAIGADLSTDYVAAHSLSLVQKPIGKYGSTLTDLEQRLQKLWASILGTDPSRISRNDSFYHVGGDSIAAMRLAGAAYAEGLTLTIIDIFQHPQLFDLAAVVGKRPPRGELIVEVDEVILDLSSTLADDGRQSDEGTGMELLAHGLVRVEA